MPLLSLNKKKEIQKKNLKFLGGLTVKIKKN